MFEDGPNAADRMQSKGGPSFVHKLFFFNSGHKGMTNCKVNIEHCKGKIICKRVRAAQKLNNSTARTESGMI